MTILISKIAHGRLTPQNTGGEENLQFLLQPARLKKALEALDVDGSGEIDLPEWEEARGGAVQPTDSARPALDARRGSIATPKRPLGLDASRP